MKKLIFYILKVTQILVRIRISLRTRTKMSRIRNTGSNFLHVPKVQKGGSWPDVQDAVWVVGILYNEVETEVASGSRIHHSLRNNNKLNIYKKNNFVDPDKQDT